MRSSFGKLIIVSGPSGVGKTNLLRSFQKFYPKLSSDYESLVYFVTRPARAEERHGVDRFFLSREEIEKFRNNKDYIVVKVRHDLHAACCKSVIESLKLKNVIYEGSPYLGVELLNHPDLREVEKLSIFISPVSKEEMLFFNSPDSKINMKHAIEKIISMKLLKRTLKQKRILSLEDYEDISSRVAYAFEELKYAPRFDYVIPNHDGEESENWDCFYYPIGEARRTLTAFVELLSGKIPETFVEKWDEKIFEISNSGFPNS